MGQSRYHSEGASIWELPSHPRDARTLMLLNYLLAWIPTEGAPLTRRQEFRRIWAAARARD